MYLFLLIISIIVCVFLVLMVLIQNPKGGGLSSNFSASSQLMGVQKTGDFLEKGTWILAITIMVLSLAINVSVKGGADKPDNSQQSTVDKASKPATSTSTPFTPKPITPPTTAPANKTK